MVMVFIGQMFSKDFDTKFYNVLFTKPITKAQYICGRLLGNMIMVLVAIALAMACIELSLVIFQKIPRDLVLTPNILYHIVPFVTTVIPNLLFWAVCFMAIVIVTKKTSLLFISYIVINVVTALSNHLVGLVDRQVLAALLDPSGSNAVSLSHRGWTAVEMNTQLIGMIDLVLYNRLIWIGVSLVILVFAWKRFNFEMTFGKKEKKGELEISNEKLEIKNWIASSQAPRNDKGGNTKWLKFQSEFILNMKMIFKSPLIYILAGLGLAMAIQALIMAGRIYGTPTLPVTYQVADTLDGSFGFFLMIIITFYTGELVFRARERKFNQIEDCLPISTFHSFIAKFTPLVALIVGFFVLAILTGVVFQAINGYFRFELHVYLTRFFLLELPSFLYFLMLSFFLHTVINQKYAAHFAFLLFFMAMGFFSYLGIEHRLLLPFSSLLPRYSDMSGWGNNVVPHIWFRSY